MNVSDNTVTVVFDVANDADADTTYADIERRATAYRRNRVLLNILMMALKWSTWWNALDFMLPNIELLTSTFWKTCNKCTDQSSFMPLISLHGAASSWSARHNVTWTDRGTTMFINHDRTSIPYRGCIFSADKALLCCSTLRLHRVCSPKRLASTLRCHLHHCFVLQDGHENDQNVQCYLVESDCQLLLIETHSLVFATQRERVPLEMRLSAVERGWILRLSTCHHMLYSYSFFQG